MKKLTIFVFSLVFALSVPMLAAAQEMGHHMGPGMQSGMKQMHRGGEMDGMRGGLGEMGMAMMSRMPWFYLRHSKELKLSDDQVNSIKKISFDMRKDMITKGADVKVRRLELAEILAKPDYKLDDATAKLKDIEDARLALESAMLQHAAQARDVLTADQLKSLKDIRRHEFDKSCGKGCGGKSCGKDMKRHMREKGNMK